MCEYCEICYLRKVLFYYRRLGYSHIYLVLVFFNTEIFDLPHEKISLSQVGIIIKAGQSAQQLTFSSMSMFLFLNLELLLRASPGMPAIVLFLNTCVIVQYHKKKKKCESRKLCYKHLSPRSHDIVHPKLISSLIPKAYEGSLNTYIYHIHI